MLFLSIFRNQLLKAGWISYCQIFQLLLSLFVFVYQPFPWPFAPFFQVLQLLQLVLKHFRHLFLSGGHLWLYHYILYWCPGHFAFSLYLISFAWLNLLLLPWIPLRQWWCQHYCFEQKQAQRKKAGQQLMLMLKWCRFHDKIFTAGYMSQA